ncbi:exosome complex exonuclease [Hirsutella rhossiliensis]|uniref:Exosome complex exonuclease n=1 Tax=Hirsutella rhossiliensis TaxID=111463 RepID=A0A9P8MNJ7_9HYPO|nr:exosome complex exonuclease [Hirsutella rhossiliensis]KAH0958350.1 exosome complex exonuclease [Hirsutella rhossiliensis]
MAGDKIPSLHALEKPEDLKVLMRQDRGDDCLSCRIVGSGAFFGLAAYSYLSGMSQLEKQRAAILKSRSVFGIKSRRAGIAGISLGLAWMGLWRAFR